MAERRVLTNMSEDTLLENREEGLLGELTKEEMESLQKLHSANRDLHMALAAICVEEKSLEERKDAVLQQIRKELPRKEQELKDIITERVGSTNWKVSNDGKIYSE